MRQLSATRSCSADPDTEDSADATRCNLSLVLRCSSMITQVLAVRIAVALCAFLCSGAVSWAQEQTPALQETSPPGGAAALQKAVQNPVASLISVPIQNNSNFGIGPYDRTQNVLNIQPVIPIRASENWNVIIRWIAPVISQPAPGTANLEIFGIEEGTPPYLAAQNVQRSAGVFGFGDMTPTFFLSPAKPRKLIWGAGPVLVLPTATSKVLGQGKLSMGPSFVALTQPGPWTLGALVNNVWSVAGSGGRPAVNQVLLQYFINYNLKRGWYISLAPIITANWKASGGNVWAVPFGGGIGRVTKIGFQPINVTAQFYGNAVRPGGAASWSMRLQIAFLFPKLNKEQQMLLMQQKLKQLQQQ
jgi:hypothetical protein